MNIKILGTRGEIEESAPYHSKKSGILIDDVLMIDVGDKSFLKHNPKAILITHLHPDHAYFVRRHKKPDTNVPIYAPEKYDDVDIHVTKKPFKVLVYTITPIPTVHSLKVKSNAYIIDDGNKKILYTGDMIWINKKYHHRLKNLNLVITEASFMRTGGMVRRKDGKIYGHTGVPNLISLFKRFTCMMTFMHFGAWFYKDMQKAQKEFKKLAKENGINIIVSYD